MIEVACAAAESRTGGRWRWARAGHPVQHRLDRGHLAPAFSGIVAVVITPPIPAAVRVGPRESRPDVQCVRLRIQHDHVVRVRPLVVAGVPDERVAESSLRTGRGRSAGILPATVEYDVHAAEITLLAGSRNICPAGLPHAVRSWVGDELVLIEFN